MAKECHVVREKVSYINRVGQVHSRVNGTITIKECADTARIHVGMYLRAGVSHDALRTGSLEVISTDEDSGIVVVAGSSGVNGLCDGDHLYWVAER